MTPKPDAVVRFEEARDSLCDIKFRGGDIDGCEYDAARFGYERGSTESPHVLALVDVIKDTIICRTYHEKCQQCLDACEKALKQFNEIRDYLKGE
jgi:hypothetical protein